MKVDVFVSGAGIVGLATALAVAERSDLQVVVVDISDPPTPPPNDRTFDAKMIALNQRSLNFLDRLGVLTAIKEQRHSHFYDMKVWEQGYEEILHFNYKDMDNIERLGTLVESCVICYALWQRVREQKNIRVLFNKTVETVRSSGQELLLSGGENVTCHLLCIADGARSVLRARAGFKSFELDCSQSVITTTASTALPHQNTAWQKFLPTGPLAFLPLPQQHLSSIVWSIDNTQVEDIYALPENEFAQQLSSRFDFRLGEVKEIGPRYKFPLHQHNTWKYILPNRVLLGDSAHSIHPLAGQGANIGLADAEALADNMMARTGLACNDMRILRAYERQRQLPDWVMSFAMDGMRRLFANENSLMKSIRRMGISFFNQQPYMKSRMMAHAE